MKIVAILATTIIVLLATLIWQITDHRQIYFNERCFANIEYLDASSDNSLPFHGNIVFEFLTDQTGQFNLSGTISHNEKEYTFSRYVKFSYKNIVDNNYRLKIHAIEALSHDNVPEEISEFVIKRLTLSGERTIYLQKNDASVITIGNPLTPMFNCVIQS
ncbi:hypothetical protein GWD52_05630 [Enterobacteriaceae bacterium 4M9]|nr:hypothetical protein [Enterobacteriaceae bacterium 4M9]